MPPLAATHRKRTIAQIDVAGLRVLMRVDFNVPLDASGAITDDRRIVAALESIRSVVERRGRLVLMSHLGRPEGAGYEAAFTLRPAADRLAELLGDVPVRFVEGDCAGPDAAEAVAALGDGEIAVLENLRFNPGEKAGDPEFASALAALGDVYCHEAFGTAHRTDASVVAVPLAMRGRPRVAGLLLDREIRYLAGTLADPKRPFVAVLGGAKVSDKLAALENLIGTVDAILVGGAMAYTFLLALGRDVGSSLVEPDRQDDARRIMDAAAGGTTELLLPVDHACAREISTSAPVQICDESIPEGWMGLDIGPRAIAAFAERIGSCATVVWNGPVGVFETPPFDAGTRGVAEAIARAADGGAVAVAGGGDTAAAVDEMGLADRFSHVSTGGGASLKMLEGGRFESVDLLDDA